MLQIRRQFCFIKITPSKLAPYVILCRKIQKTQEIIEFSVEHFREKTRNRSKQKQIKIKTPKSDVHHLLLPGSFDVVTVVPPGAKGSFFFDSSA